MEMAHNLGTRARKVRVSAARLERRYCLHAHTCSGPKARSTGRRDSELKRSVVLICAVQEIMTGCRLDQKQQRKRRTLLGHWFRYHCLKDSRQTLKLRKSNSSRGPWSPHRRSSSGWNLLQDQLMRDMRCYKSVCLPCGVSQLHPL